MEIYLKISVDKSGGKAIIFLKERNIFGFSHFNDCDNSYNCAWKALEFLVELLNFLKSKGLEIKDPKLFIAEEAILGQLKDVYKIREEKHSATKLRIKKLIQEFYQGKPDIGLEKFFKKEILFPKYPEAKICRIKEKKFKCVQVKLEPFKEKKLF